MCCVSFFLSVQKKKKKICHRLVLFSVLFCNERVCYFPRVLSQGQLRHSEVLSNLLTSVQMGPGLHSRVSVASSYGSNKLSPLPLSVRCMLGPGSPFFTSGAGLMFVLE